MKSRLRHPEMPVKQMVDLYQVFLNEPIVVKGALNYSLKSIAKAMFEFKLINTIWDSNSQCANGLNAMLIAHNIYSKTKNVTNEIPMMKEIEKYNEIDCKCLWEIIRYLRKIINLNLKYLKDTIKLIVFNLVKPDNELFNDYQNYH